MILPNLSFYQLEITCFYSKAQVQDSLNFIVRDWQKALEGIAESLAVIDKDREDTIEIDNNIINLLHTA